MERKVVSEIMLTLLFIGLSTLTFDIQPVKSEPTTIIVPDDYEKFVVVKASFHTHTTYSDGDYTPTEVVHMYSEAGYDCIAITDHQTLAGVAEAKAVGETLSMIIISGEEITYNFADGTPKHIVGLFLTQAILNSEWNKNDIIKPIFDAVHQQDGIAFVAHPWSSKSSMEFAESPWYSYRTASYIDGWETNNLNEIEVNAFLDAGYFCVYNHDFHRGTVPSGIFTLLYCHNRTELGIKEALINQRNVLFYQGRVWGTNEALALYGKYVRPVASFTYSPSEPVVNETITFDASASYDPDGTIGTYIWDFGDGNVTTRSNPVIGHPYRTVGTYNVVLNVTDNHELTDESIKSIIVGKLGSIISISAFPTTITIGQTININGLITPASEGVNVTVWNRPNGEEAWSILAIVPTDENSEYSYDWVPLEGGTYELKSSWLGDENTLGARSSTITITRLAPPVASFTYSPPIPYVGEEITFDASSSFDVDKDIVSYRWNFDDGNISLTVSPIIVHTFGLHGAYNVTLTVIDAADLNSPNSQTVSVKMPTVVSISTSCPSTFVGFRVNVTGTLRDMYGNGLGNETVVLFYTFSEIIEWVPITSDATDNLGNYQAIWIPPATGYFIIKAEWAGNTTHLGASKATTLSSLVYENQYVFSVESNTTISALAFNTTDWTFSFTATGLNGSRGYVKITITKSLVNNILNIRVYLDGDQTEYSITSIDDSWLLTFNYLYSIHKVAVNLSIYIIPEFPTWTLMLLILVVLIAASAIYKRR